MFYLLAHALVHPLWRYGRCALMPWLCVMLPCWGENVLSFLSSVGRRQCPSPHRQPMHTLVVCPFLCICDWHKPKTAFVVAWQDCLFSLSNHWQRKRAGMDYKHSGRHSASPFISVAIHLTVCFLPFTIYIPGFSEPRLLALVSTFCPSVVYTLYLKFSSATLCMPLSSSMSIRL